MKPILTAAVLAGLTAVLPLGAKPVPRNPSGLPPTIHCDFRNKNFNQDAFDVWGVNTDKRITRETEGLRISLPASDGLPTPVGIILRYDVCGDFEFNATMDILKAPAFFGGFNGAHPSGIKVLCQIEPPPRHSFFVGKMLDRRPGSYFHAGVAAEINEDRRDRVFEEKLDSNQLDGKARIRLVRRGAIVEFSAREEEASNFTILGAVNVGADDIQLLRLTAEAGHAPVDVRILNCSIQAKKLLPK
jgi:hypothetical protein